jgi:DNA-binding CsgD family transcriptional regulator
MAGPLTLVDAPPSYHETPDLDHPDQALCSDCERPVTSYPCPLHGPGSLDPTPGPDMPSWTVEGVAPDVMNLARIAYYVIHNRDPRPDGICPRLHLGKYVVERHLATLETRWKIVGRDTPKSRLRSVIHPEHANRVANTILKSRGVPLSPTPFAPITLPLLTPTDYIIIASLAEEGMSNDEIGERLTVSGSTIRTHLKRIYTVCGARNRAHLVHRAHVLGLLGGIPQETTRPHG